MTKFDHAVLPDTATVRDAMDAINRGSLQIALVTDESGRLRATVTDGDVRRGILRGVSLDARVTDVMNTNFTAVSETEGRAVAERLMQLRSLHQVPVLDNEGKLVDLYLADAPSRSALQDTHVVLMAGGLGTRLRPLTETIPKPMLKVAGRPILELILQSFLDQGFRNFTVSLNYKREMISDHFGDGHRFGAHIEYVEEDKRMGTAGALALLDRRPDAPFIVMNGDLLTAIPFEALVRFHTETGAMGTMCARDFPVHVPYGVIEVDGTALKKIVEKPTFTHLVNAGIYVLSPEALDHVRPDEFLDMPTLFERIIDGGARASVFPIQEFWMDIGRPEDLRQADEQYADAFGAGNGDHTTDD